MLEVRQITQRFGAVTAVDAASFQVAPGECVAMIGPNGAGKSTTFACIAGQYRDFDGQVLWRGDKVHHWSPQRRMAAGMVRTFQVARTFESLTVLQNVQLLLAAPQGLRPWTLLDSCAPQRAMDLLVRVGLGNSAQQSAASLAYGARKRLELAMALAGWVPGQQGGLLLLDEPAAGLSEEERRSMMALVRSLTAADQGGHTVLYTEHNMDAVFGVADRVLVLMNGRIVADGTPTEIASDPLVRSHYLGQDFVLEHRDV